MTSLLYIPDSKVRELIQFDTVYDAVKVAFESVATNNAVQNARGILRLIPSQENCLFTMPGYLYNEKYGSLGCKLVTMFPKNVLHGGMPSIMANILFMDECTGAIKAVIAGTEITLWRTAAASAVATTYLHKNKEKNILAIIGAGPQGEIHALAFNHYFFFKEVRIWSRTSQNARNLVEKLNRDNNEIFVAFDNIEDCVKDADVIVTATSSAEPIIKNDWLKKGVHINAVGVTGNGFELDAETYVSSHVYVDSWEGAKSELSALNIEFKGQIGDLVTGSISAPETTTIFQSLGMAAEDCAVARMIYDQYMESKKL